MRHVCDIHDFERVTILIKLPLPLESESRQLGLFLYNKRTLGEAAGNCVTYNRAGLGGFVFASFSYEKPLRRCCELFVST